MNRPPRCLPCFAAAYLLVCTACVGGKLSPAAAVAIEGAELAACSVLLPLAVPGQGTADALACQGSESLLKGILDGISAPAAQPAIGATGGSAGPPPPLVRVAVARAGKVVGFVPRSVAGEVQAKLLR